MKSFDRFAMARSGKGQEPFSRKPHRTQRTDKFRSGTKGVLNKDACVGQCACVDQDACVGQCACVDQDACVGQCACVDQDACVGQCACVDQDGCVGQRACVLQVVEASDRVDVDPGLTQGVQLLLLALRIRDQVLDVVGR